MRDLYEVPAAAIILTAHRELEKLVSTRHQNLFKPGLDAQWGFMVYAGLWQEPLLEDLNAYMDKANEQVTGTIALKLYKGRADAIRRSSPNALYDAALAVVHRVRWPVLTAREPGLHRALDAPVADGVRDPQPRGRRRVNTGSGATTRFDWIVWQVMRTVLRRSSARPSQSSRRPWWPPSAAVRRTRRKTLPRPGKSRA